MHPGPVPVQQTELSLGDPFNGSTLTCTGTPYGTDPCNCIYHVLTRAFTPPLPKRVRTPRSFSTRRIYRQTKKPNQEEAMF